MHKFLGNNFKNCEDKILLVVPVLDDKCQISKILEKIKQKKGVDLNEDDIAVYGYVSDSKKQKEKLKATTNSELINRIKPKPYNTKLWKFVCSNEIKTIYFYGSFNKAIEKKIEEKNLGKIPLKDLIDRNGINVVPISLSRETSVSKIQVENEKFLNGLKYDITGIMGKMGLGSLASLFPNTYRFQEANWDKNIHINIREDQYNILYNSYQRAIKKILKMQRKIDEILGDENKEIECLKNILGLLTANELFIPVSMLLDILDKTQNSPDFANRLFSLANQSNFPIVNYNDKFNGESKKSDLKKSEKRLNELYQKIKKANPKSELLDLMKERIYREENVQVTKILWLPSAYGGIFIKGSEPYPEKKLKSAKESDIDLVKDKVYHIDDKKKLCYGEYRLNSEVLWKPQKKS